SISRCRCRSPRSPAGSSNAGRRRRVNDLILRLQDVHLRRGSRQILGGVTLEVARGELIAVMGPSGSGKTTILRTIAGLEAFQSGHVAIEEVTLGGGVAPSAAMLGRLRRKVGMVFQFHCLFEH